MKLEPCRASDIRWSRISARSKTPLWSAPGGGYSYSSQSPHVASIVLRHLIGMEMQEYISEKLAKPMGWGVGLRLHRGEYHPAACARRRDTAVRVHRRAALRYLLLHKGQWGQEAVGAGRLHRNVRQALAL